MTSVGPYRRGGRPPACKGGCGGSGGSTTGASVLATSSSAGHPTSSPSCPAPATVALPKSTADQLTAQLTSYIAAKNLVGLSAAVVTPKGNWAGGVGVDCAGKTIRAERSSHPLTISHANNPPANPLCSPNVREDADHDDDEEHEEVDDHEDLESDFVRRIGVGSSSRWVGRRCR